MDQRKPPSRTVKTTDTVFAIIEKLGEMDGATVTAIADELGIAKSTASDHLATLEQLNYVVHEDGTYYLGLRFLEHGNTARNRLKVRKAAKDPLKDLADATGESAWLVVEEADETVFIDKALGEQAFQTMGKIGRRARLHTTAAGKAILAHLPTERREAIIYEYDLPPRTPHTITEPDVLAGELAEIRERGIAFNDEESNLGVRAVASPILCDGRVLGSLAISGPKSRLSIEDVNGPITEELRRSTNLVELNVQHDSE